LHGLGKHCLAVDSQLDSIKPQILTNIFRQARLLGAATY
jgi:hypothetical protein